MSKSIGLHIAVPADCNILTWSVITPLIFTLFSLGNLRCIVNKRRILLRILTPRNLCSKHTSEFEHVDGMWRLRPARLSFFWQDSFCASAVPTWHLINEITEQVLAGKETWRAKQEQRTSLTFERNSDNKACRRICELSRRVH